VGWPVDHGVTSPITYDQVVSWDEALAELTGRVAGPLFRRPEPRATFGDLVRALLADVPRKNSWQLADHVGHRNAYRFEWLLGGAKWDADVLRDQVRAYVVEHLGADDGVLIADDTQAIKKGDKSVGVAYQHCGATGQVENCQVLPMLTYASARGHAFINRRLYLPQSWTEDPGRCAAAGVPAEVEFATKPQQVIGMLAEEIAAATPFGWFTADSGYGRDPALRAFCHGAEVPYVMAVPVDLPLIGSRGQATRADKAASRLTGADFERRSAGQGTKGGRYYDWAAITVRVKDQPPADGYAHLLLVRRSISDPTDFEHFLCHAPPGTTIPQLIAIAGMRWKIEENNEHGKDLVGLDQYQVRKWTPWHRHVTTCMLAVAFLAVTAADTTATDQGKDPRNRERSLAR
jgi:SRSO17 transposase